MSTAAAIPTALRDAPLLAGCSGERLAQLAARSTEQALAPGELLFGEADVADCVWVLLAGELDVTKRAEGGSIGLDHLRPGAFLGEISLLTGTPAAHQARACGPARLLRVPGAEFRELLATCQPVAETVLRTMAERVRRIEHLLQRHERMATLGTMSADLAHELNNPAAAVVRDARLLRETVDALLPVVQRLAARQWTASELLWLGELEAVARAAPPPLLPDPIQRADDEDALRDWLQARGVDDLDELVTDLLDVGLTQPRVAELLERATLPPDAAADALAWVAHASALRCLADDTGQSATRISELVKAVKEYSHLDGTSGAGADVRRGIETTLKLLGHKLRVGGISVKRAFAPELPLVPAFGGELHQVWTNLLDNAIDALQGREGTITVGAAPHDGMLHVTIADDGPGIPPEIRERIFDPFFTTKEAGKGTGLGLEIVQRVVQRHGGRVRVESEAGRTAFVVELPVARE